MIGEHLSHYRIAEQIGAGGMGVVYLARRRSRLGSSSRTATNSSRRFEKSS